MILPYTVDVPMVRLPIANWALIALTMVLSFKGLVTPADQSKDEVMRLYQFAEPKPPPAGALFRGSSFSVPQLFTYVLVHDTSNFMSFAFHLVGNMIFLFCFGNAMNAKLGHAPFLALYFLFGAVAGLAWLVLGSGAALIGASGAIAGMLGMFLVFYPKNDVRILYMFGIGGAGTFEIAAYWVVLVAMASDLWGTLSSAGPVAYVCHLGGELFGMGVAIGLLLAGLYRPTEYEENLLQMLGFEKSRRKYKVVDLRTPEKRRSSAPSRPPRKRPLRRWDDDDTDA